jgi:hypothetical protein
MFVIFMAIGVRVVSLSLIAEQRQREHAAATRRSDWKPWFDTASVLS